MLTLFGCMAGLFMLDDSTDPLGDRLFSALWNAANTISMIGDLNPLNHDQEGPRFDPDLRAQSFQHVSQGHLATARSG